MSVSAVRASLRSAIFLAVKQRSVAAMALAAVVLGTLIVVLGRGLHPFREPGLFTLQSFAAVDLFLTVLLLARLTLAFRPVTADGWQPTDPGWELIRRHLGCWLAITALLGGLVLVQYASALTLHDAIYVDPLNEQEESLAPGYGLLVLLLSGTVFVLLSWTQLFTAVFRPSIALLGLLTLILTGSILPQIQAPTAALRIVTSLIPNLASLSPIRIAPGGAADPVLLFGYALAHGTCVNTLTAFIATSGRRSLWSPVDG